MAINKKLIHFKKYSDFNSKKLSANEANTQYTVGIGGTVSNGSPDILYQSVCWIKDVQKMWTHGTVYDCSGGVNADLSNYVTQAELDELVEFVDDMNSDISNLINTKQENITDLQAIREGAAKGATSVQPSDLADVATSGSYNDLSDKPTIPSAVTESTVSGWGFTKNTGTYSKPSGGIPQSDLAEEVKAALRKAEQYTGTVTEIKVNGNNIGASGGVVDLGNLGTYSKPTTGIPKSDLSSDVQTSLEKADTAVQPADIKDVVYIADFTMESLKRGMNSGTDVDCNIQALVTSMNANKVILVREDEDLEGVHVLNGFAEDLVYFSIVDSSGNILWCDGVDYIESQGIAARTLHLQDWWEKQDTLVSGENIKTINGESVLGSGNITIEGGGGEDIRYFTEFTVEDFIEACESGGTITSDTTELFNAMKSNKVICVPYRGHDKGFIVASYKSGEDEEYPLMYLQKGDVEYHAWTGDSHELNGEYPTYNSVQVVEMAGGEVTFEVLDNHIYKITDPVDYLIAAPYNIQKGTTIHFMSGEFGATIEITDYTFWANGGIPQIEPNTYYELSIILNVFNYYNAVLTPFKPA